MAAMFAAIGGGPRLRILRQLLAVHPRGLVTREIQATTGIAGSTLSHHLERLKHADLVTADREKTYIRYRAHAAALEELLQFLYAECCTRNSAIDPAHLAPRRK